MSSVIKIDNLTKSYGKHRGVANVSFAVEEGDIFGFLGRLSVPCWDSYGFRPAASISLARISAGKRRQF